MVFYKFISNNYRASLLTSVLCLSDESELMGVLYGDDHLFFYQ